MLRAFVALLDPPVMTLCDLWDDWLILILAELINASRREPQRAPSAHHLINHQTLNLKTITYPESQISFI